MDKCLNSISTLECVLGIVECVADGKLTFHHIDGGVEVGGNCDREIAAFVSLGARTPYIWSSVITY